MASRLAPLAGIAILLAGGAIWGGCSYEPPSPPPGLNQGLQMAPCQEEDGSTPGQIFPCQWDGSKQGNGIGATFILTMPRCDPDDIILGQAPPRDCNP